MTCVQLREIDQSFSGAPVLRDVNLSVRSGRYLVLLGPSGCGKTTLLRIIAGLQDPDEGNVLFNDVSVKKLPPRQRDIAMVFQQEGLYPHRTVSQSIRLGLNRDLAADKIESRIRDAVRLTRIESIMDRYPDRLSGGEMRRAAIAKAIARRASVRLLDEPLSALDGPVRQSLQDDLASWHSEVPGTTIHVTHDGQEAMRLADEIAVIEEGTIIQSGTPETIYAKPESATVARSIGSQSMNLFPGSICNGQVRSNDESLAIELSVGSAVPNQEVLIGIRPDAFLLTSEPTPVTFAGRAERIRRVEREFELLVAGESTKLHAKVAGFDKQTGDQVRLSASIEELHLFAASSGRRIASP